MNTLTSIRDWSEAGLTSLAAALAVLLAAIPKILGFAIILIIGWVIAAAVSSLIGAVLRRVQFNRLAADSGFSGFVHGMGVETDAAGFIGDVAKWFVRLVALVVAFDALGLPAVSDVLRQLLLWLPNLVVGIVVLVVGGLLANAAAGVVRGSVAQAGFSNPDLMAQCARVAVWVFAIVVAANQIGIAQALVNTLFMGIVGAAALAIGLSFGLGGRETAAEILRSWHQKIRANAPKIDAAAETAVRRVAAPGGGPQPLPPRKSS
ncbi:MAG: hypothetical protein U1E56_09215 [Bauldia sp.]